MKKTTQPHRVRNILLIAFLGILALTMIIFSYSKIKANTTTANSARAISNIYAIKLSNVNNNTTNPVESPVSEDEMTNSRYLPEEYAERNLYYLGCTYLSAAYPYAILSYNENNGLTESDIEALDLSEKEQLIQDRHDYVISEMKADIESIFSLANDESLDFIKFELIEKINSITTVSNEVSLKTNNKEIVSIISAAKTQNVLYHVFQLMIFIDCIGFMGFILYGIINNKQLKEEDSRKRIN